MAVLQSNFPTLADLARHSDDSGKIMAVTEILNETNEILDDMAWKVGNLPTGERTTLRTALPTPTWRSFNEFVSPSKAGTTQVTFNCGMLEAFAEIDCALADLNGNTAAFRMSEDRAHIEGMSQEMANTVFYGDEDSNPDRFTGLQAYYNALSGQNNSDNVINGGDSLSGSGDSAVAGDHLQSIYLVVWGDAISGIVPKGSTAGIQVNDLGKKLIQGVSSTSTARNADPGRMMAYVSHYRWDAGLALRDWRYVVRICNIPVNQGMAGLDSVTPDFTTLTELMYQAMARIPNMSGGRPVFYMSRPTMMIVQQMCSRLVSESNLSFENVGGKMTTSFQGIPIKRVDALAGDETLLS